MESSLVQTDKQKEVSDYYGKQLQASSDLKTNACTIGKLDMTPSQKKYLALVHDDIITKDYGCGTPFPEALEGATVLDLGSGAGKDAYVMSGLVGENGRVIGIDMTDEQLDVARKHIEYHRETYGYAKSNVEFHKGVIEDLRSSGIEDNSVDVVISNCVINLVEDKTKVFQEIWRVLKPGGELYFSDVYSDRRVSKELQDDKVIWGECISGALYVEDFRRAMEKIGFVDTRMVSGAVFELGNAEIRERCGDIKFYSVTTRSFKVEGLEDRGEDYGQTVTYRGSVRDHEKEIRFDNHLTFKAGEAVPVDRNTALMLSKSRFSQHFEISPEGAHRGVLELTGTGCCSDIRQVTAKQASGSSSSGGSCCAPAPAKKSCC